MTPGPTARDLAGGIDAHHVREGLRDAEDAAPDVSVAVIDADRAVPDDDLADAGRRRVGLLQSEPVEATVVPENDRQHQRAPRPNRRRERIPV